MALTPIPRSPYPSVPNVSGVPAVLRQVASVQNTAVLLVADAAQVASLFSGPQWGLFLSDGTPAFQSASLGSVIATVVSAVGLGGESVIDLSFEMDHIITSAPQEEGAFVSYNKVANPFVGRVTYAVDGVTAIRSMFLNQVVALQESLTLVNLVMPEITYPSCNVMHHDFRRVTRNGGTPMILVNVWVEQIRVSGTTAYTNPAHPDGANPVNGGAVQPSASTSPPYGPT